MGGCSNRGVLSNLLEMNVMLLFYLRGLMAVVKPGENLSVLTKSDRDKMIPTTATAGTMRRDVSNEPHWIPTLRPFRSIHLFPKLHVGVSLVNRIPSTLHPPRHSFPDFSQAFRLFVWHPDSLQ